MAKPIYVINGPNLNRLGKREPEVYGTTTLAAIEAMCRQAAAGTPVTFLQSNAESEIIGWIHEAIDEAAAIVINPAGLTFTSVSIVDALKMFSGPIVELHITNIHRREAIYRNSLVSGVATGVMAGFGAGGYALAIAAVMQMLAGDETPATGGR